MTLQGAAGNQLVCVTLIACYDLGPCAADLPGRRLLALSGCTLVSRLEMLTSFALTQGIKFEAPRSFCSMQRLSSASVCNDA